MNRPYFLGSMLVLSILLVNPGDLMTQGQGAERSGKKASEQKQSHQSANMKGSVIGHLESRNRIITITSGPKGPLYTVKTKDGKTLATKIDEKALQAQYPDIYHELKSGVAGDDATVHPLR